MIIIMKAEWTHHHSASIAREILRLQKMTSLLSLQPRLRKQLFLQPRLRNVAISARPSAAEDVQPGELILRVDDQDSTSMGAWRLDPLIQPNTPPVLLWCRTLVGPSSCADLLGSDNPGCCYLKSAVGWTTQQLSGAVSGTLSA